MYQYHAILVSTQQIVAEGHTLEEVEHGVLHFRRGQKRHEHTHGHDRIEIYHIERNNVSGSKKEKLIKAV